MKTMRLEWLLLLFGLSCATLAADTADSDVPDAALLEFLADWSEDDRQWLENEMDNERTDAALPTAPVGEVRHD